MGSPFNLKLCAAFKFKCPMLMLLLVITGMGSKGLMAQSEAEAPFRLEINYGNIWGGKSWVWSGEKIAYKYRENARDYQEGVLEDCTGDSLLLSGKWIPIDSIAGLKHFQHRANPLVLYSTIAAAVFASATWGVFAYLKARTTNIAEEILLVFLIIPAVLLGAYALGFGLLMLLFTPFFKRYHRLTRSRPLFSKRPASKRQLKRIRRIERFRNREIDWDKKRNKRR